MSRHVLIIEDEALIAWEIEDLLRDIGYETFDWADNPDEAVGSALARRPALITADLRIVGGTGIEAVERISAELGPVPVVYITANDDLLRGDPHATIVGKPIRARELYAACRRKAG